MRALLRTEQAAEFLGLSPRTLESWRWRGYGPPYVQVTPRAIRYRIEDLEAWVEDQVRTSTSEDQERGPADA